MTVLEPTFKGEKISDLVSPQQLREQVVLLVETDDYSKLDEAFCAYHYADEFADTPVGKFGTYTSIWVAGEIRNYVSQPIDIGGKKWIVVL